MSQDRHRNVFYYFRGPSNAAKLDESRVHRQLEDNTTKALMNLLEHGGEGLTRGFLEYLGIPAPSRPVEFALQGGPPAGREAPRRVLVGISKSAKVAPNSWNHPVEQGSRVDATLHARGELLVAVESKVGDGLLDGAQLVRHAKHWAIPGPDLNGVKPDLPSAWKFVRWEQIFDWARRTKDETTDPLAAFLLDQFLRYLQLSGLAPFAGLLDDDFRFFDAAPAKRDWQLLVELKGRLQELWKAVLDGLSDSERAQLGRPQVGVVRAHDQNVALRSNADDPGVNLTLEVNAAELQLDLVAWNAPTAQLIETWLESSAGADALAALPEYSLVAWKRRAKRDHKGKPFWQQASQSELDTLPAPEVALKPTAPLAAWRAQLEPGWELLAYHLRRAWPRADVVARAESIADDIRVDVRVLTPLLAAINQAK